MVKTSDKRLIEYKQQGNLAFHLSVQAQSLDEKVNTKLLMSVPLTPVPLSIGTTDGMLMKTNKTKGMCYLLKNQLSPEKSYENFTLVIEDGSALFYVLKDIPRNFKEICLKLFGMVSSKTCDMIFSIDMYHLDCVQYVEKRRKGSGDKLIIKGASTKKSKCWKEFLSNDEDKHQLIKLMLNVWQTNLTASHLTGNLLKGSFPFT